VTSAKKSQARRSHGTALLLVDLINPFDYPDAQKLAPRAVRAAEAIARLKRRTQACGYATVYANDNFGHWMSEFSALTDHCRRLPGAAGAIADLLSPEPQDFAILKPRHSAFYGTPLDFLLEELKVQRLIVAGLTADMCVFATAQDAYVRKYELWIPRDCVAAATASYETASLSHMARTMKADTRAARGSRRL